MLQETAQKLRYRAFSQDATLNPNSGVFVVTPCKTPTQQQSPTCSCRFLCGQEIKPAQPSADWVLG